MIPLRRALIIPALLLQVYSHHNFLVKVSKMRGFRCGPSFNYIITHACIFPHLSSHSFYTYMPFHCLALCTCFIDRLTQLSSYGVFFYHNHTGRKAAHTSSPKYLEGVRHSYNGEKDSNHNACRRRRTSPSASSSP